MKWFDLNPVGTHCAKHCLNAKETAMTCDALPSHADCRAQVLVAEDDGPSGHFFTTAFQDMHCRVDLVSTGRQALQLARDRDYDLLLLDCRMPDFGAVSILSALREYPSAASHASPAIATSAELDPAEQSRFRQIGFADALLKPVSLETLKNAVDAWLPAMPNYSPGAVRDDGAEQHDEQRPPYESNTSTEALLDDASAIANSGSAASVSALRQLFVRELSRLLHELDHQACQGNELSETLHRLLASCGFCGANALAAATGKLKRRLDAPTPVTPADMQQFRSVLSATLDALARPRDA